MAEKIKYGRYLHGGDYNPEQWLDCPDILKTDIEYFKKAHINTVSLGIFSWAVLEPKEGEYNFGWLAEIIDNLYAEESLRFLRHHPEHVRNGWQTSIRKYFVWMRTDREISLEEDIITVILLRFTARRSQNWTKNFLFVSENIRA